MAAIQEKITGLYVAFFDRAADKSGLDYWTIQAQSMGDNTAINQLAAGFATHVKFTQLYGSLSNQAYVEAVYTNCLGSAGDLEGIAYWTGMINSGMTRSDMVSAFVVAALDFDQNDPQYASLSQADITLALQRQAQLANKVAVSLNFVETLGSLTNLDASTDATVPEALDLDAAYTASVKMISQVTHESSTTQTALNCIGLIQGRSDAVTIINNVANITEQEISAQVSVRDQGSSLSNINLLIGTLSTSDTFGVSALDSGYYWDQNSQIITYSFNETLPQEYSEYTETDLTQEWVPLNTAQRDVFRSVAQKVNQLLGITLQEVSSDGQIKCNIVAMDSGTTGFAFYPGTDYGYDGDLFLSSRFNSNSSDFGLNQGESGWSTIVHELGHTLGLKHPFEGQETLQSNLDDTAHSIMSYTSKYNYKPVLGYDDDGGMTMTYSLIDPHLYSLYDVAALQAAYGVNSTTNTDDTTYTFSYTDFTMQTIWDAGGNDTLDLSGNLGDTTLDLRGGTLNSVDQYTLNEIVAYYQNQADDSYFYDWIETTITDLYTQDKLYTGLNNIAIAHGTIMENITTGSGNDTVTDNEVNNIINTSSGDDKIYLGNGGYDSVDGGAGTDTLYLNLLLDQITVTTQDMTVYSIITDSFAVEVTGVETVQFSDNTAYAIDILI